MCCHLKSYGVVRTVRTLSRFGLLCLLTAAPVGAQDLQQRAKAGIQRAADFYVNQAALRGGYVYYYSPDLKTRLGEGPATATQIWVQPPGTPTVGLALLEAWEAIQDPDLLKAATAAAEALIYGQLKSGAWTNSIDFDSAGKTAAYRNGRGSGRNFSTLDDGISQSAMQLLMHVDQAHQFQHKEIRQSVQIALDALLAAQFSNGGFPQGWDETPAANDHPTLAASFPTYDWRTEGRIKAYWDEYTLNDGAAGTITDTLILADRIYGASSSGFPGKVDGRYRKALQKFGDFLILAQLPEPQPAWAQQYSPHMHPIWARAFEPPAVASRESQDVIQALLSIAAATGDEKYLTPIPSAILYLERSTLPDGRLARYYELQTNRPLYMNRSGKRYSLTYDDTNLPSHYGWKIDSELESLKAAYAAAMKPAVSERNQKPEVEDVKRVLNELDDQGRWISRYSGEPLSGQPKFRPGQEYLNSEVFSNNLRLLSGYLSAPDARP